jgi:hypothetical protein
VQKSFYQQLFWPALWPSPQSQLAIASPYEYHPFAFLLLVIMVVALIAAPFAKGRLKIIFFIFAALAGLAFNWFAFT